jgi:uncharacterized domain 1
MGGMGQLETYLERIRKLGRDANPFFRLMGIEIEEIGSGKACLSLEVRPEMLNGVGWMQGGIFTSLVDEAMALALYTLTSADEQIATISETTSFIRGEREGRIVGSDGSYGRSKGGVPRRRGKKRRSSGGSARPHKCLVSSDHMRDEFEPAGILSGSIKPVFPLIL